MIRVFRPVRFTFKFHLIILLTLSTLSGCEFKHVELEKIEDIQLNSLEGGKIDGQLSLVLYNPNSFTITVKSADFVLMNDNLKLGDAKLKKSFKIDAKSTKSYPVELSGNLQNALAGGFAGIAGLLMGKKPQVTIQGELRAGNLFFTRKIPVSINTALPLGF